MDGRRQHRRDYQGDRGDGIAARELVRELRRGDDLSGPGQRLDVDAVRHNLFPGRVADRADLALRSRPGRWHNADPALLPHHAADAEANPDSGRAVASDLDV